MTRTANLRRLLPALALLLPALAGCEDDPLADGFPAPPNCSSCHGDQTSPAPPVGLEGETDTVSIAVGAHRAHLTGGQLRGAITCQECHVVPTAIADEGHIDANPAEVTFGALAAGGGATPAWDRVNARCSGTYCHGATLAGGTNPAPIWNRVGTGEAACGTCHGSPPPAPHPSNGNCFQCHPQTVTASGAIDVAGGAHINGVVEASVLGCNGCHGSAANAAPPVDTSGQSDESLITVGAHQPHLAAADWHAPVGCPECHTVPAAVDAPGHLDESPAEIVWGALAQDDGASPSWDPAAATCDGTYCHGATLAAGGTNTAPVWTTVGGGEAACGACHGAPPPAPHPYATTETCGNCHGDTIDNDLEFVDPDLHINGQVEVTLSCNSCHGGADNAAPPVDTNGASDPSLITVGAHQAHLAPSDWRAEIACTECHTVPTAWDDSGHIDDSPAELTWGARATADAAAPSWDPSTGSCSGVYCHGSTLLTGGDLLAPIWTEPEPFDVPCGTCHSLPPDDPHPVAFPCSDCHGAVIDDTYQWVDPDLHVNGAVNFGA